MKHNRLFSFICIGLSIIILAGCPGTADYSIDLPADYSIVRTSAHEIFLAKRIAEGHWSERLIPAKITDVGWNNTYIVAKQVEVGRNNGYQIPNERSNHIWRVKIGTDISFGPFNEEEYESKKKELGLEDVILKDVEELK